MRCFGQGGDTLSVKHSLPRLNMIFVIFCTNALSHFSDPPRRLPVCANLPPTPA